MLLTTTGLILREVAYGESDKLLTVLTPDQGKITVTAKGVRSFRNHYMSTAQLMCYNEFVLYQRGDRWWMKEVAVVEGFAPLHIPKGYSFLAVNPLGFVQK